MSGGVVAALVVLGLLVLVLALASGYGWGALMTHIELRPERSDSRVARAVAEMQAVHDVATREVVTPAVRPVAVRDLADVGQRPGSVRQMVNDLTQASPGMSPRPPGGAPLRRPAAS